jgi:hypothetical protein
MPYSNKLFTVELVNQNLPKVRVLVTPDAKYNPDIHFMYFEESDYLNVILNGIPYATYVTDDQDLMEDFLQNGFRYRGEVWRSFFAYWKDQEGRAYMAPESAGIKDLRDVGVFTHMKSPADFMKVGKYANRLFAALPKKLYSGTDPVWGKEVEWNESEQYALIQIEPHDDLTEDDCLLSVKYVNLDTLGDEQKAIVDGCIPISEKAARALNLSSDPRIGMVWRGTFGTERGLGKGHIPYIPHLEHDVVIYGPKTILRTGRFFFGNMSGDKGLHVGRPHTDRQAFVNFGFHRPGLAVDLAKTYMREVVQKSKDEAGMRQLILNHTKDTPNAELGNDGWILRRSLAYGISFLRFPGLFRRAIRYLAGPNSPVFQSDTRARIPMESDTYSVAKYGYVMPDLNTIDKDGIVHPELGIGEGEIIFPDLPAGTKVVCYRQPSENSNAWVMLTVVDKPEFRRFKGRGICMLGRGAMEVLGRLGGGDMDDQFVIVHDPKWVEAFTTLRPYPETIKISAMVTEEEQELFDQEQSELSSFTDELLDDIRSRRLDFYSNKHVHWQIDMAKNARAGIGPVVNYGIMDMLLSDPDQSDSMLADLANNPEAAEWVREYREWEYTGDDLAPNTTPFGYHARRDMTNLELIIDGNVKDSTLLHKLGDVAGDIRKFHKNCKVYPASQATGDPKTDRVPKTKRAKGDYVTARSLTCKALERIRQLRERLMEIFAEREWAMVTPADKELRVDYPFEREIHIRVAGEYKRVDEEWIQINEEPSLKDIWAQAWKAELSNPEQDEAHRATAYKRIVDMIQGILKDEDDDTMERLAVDLYFDSYKQHGTGAKLDESGRYRTYPDGLLWSPVFANHFINALRKARLSGFYKAVEIRPEYIGRLKDISTVVQVRAHSVYIQDSNDQFTQYVGMVTGKCPDGKYRMDKMLIEVRRPQPICLPEDYTLMPQQPLARVIESRVEPTVVKPQSESTPEPSSTVGKMLRKALDLLK